MKQRKGKYEIKSKGSRINDDVLLYPFMKEHTGNERKKKYRIISYEIF